MASVRKTLCEREHCTAAREIFIDFLRRPTLKAQLREQGARHDLVDAVFALEGQDDLLLIVRRVEALGKFLDTEDGKNLLAGYKRATNIIRIEEKKDSREYTGAPDQVSTSSRRKRRWRRRSIAAKAEADASSREGRFRGRHARHGESCGPTSMPSSTR